MARLDRCDSISDKRAVSRFKTQDTRCENETKQDKVLGSTSRCFHTYSGAKHVKEQASTLCILRSVACSQQRLNFPTTLTKLLVLSQLRVESGD